ncbi:hypothetical protein [Niallia sp. FSL R7-0271]
MRGIKDLIEKATYCDDIITNFSYPSSYKQCR